MTVKKTNQGGLGDLVSARVKLRDGAALVQEGLDLVGTSLTKLNGATSDYAIEVDRLGKELDAAEERGYERRDMDGQRLYLLLAMFDRRDGTPMSNLVQAAREGWERSHTDMDEDDAWSRFDSFWACREDWS